MLLTTAVSFGNQWLGNSDFNGKILVAGLIATGGLALAEKVIGGTAAAGLAWICFITLFFVNPAGGQNAVATSPAGNIKKLTGL